MNSSFIHADIFFYITTIAIVILTVLLIIVFFYIIRIVKHLEQTALKIKKESERVIEDISFVRESIEDQGGRLLTFAKFIFASISKVGFGKPTEEKGKKNTRARAEKRTERVKPD